jgi:hypothetical protein
MNSPYLHRQQPCSGIWLGGVGVEGWVLTRCQCRRGRTGVDGRFDGLGGQAAAVRLGSGPGDQSAVLQAAQDSVQGLVAGGDAAGEFGVGQSGAPADQFQARILWRGEFGGRSTASIAARRAAAAFLRV